MRQLKPVPRSRLSLYILLLVLALITIFFVRQCSTPRPAPLADRRAGGDTLNVAIELSPMTLSVSADTLSGFSYDLMRAIAAIHGRPVVFNGFTNLPHTMQRLLDGRYDVVIADMPVTSTTRRSFLFTDPIYLDRAVLVQLPDSTGSLPITGQQALARREVWVPAGTPLTRRLHALGREIGDTIYVREDSDYSEEQLIMLTAVGELPCAVVNSRVARQLAREYPRLDLSVEISFNQFKAWALAPRDSALTDTLNSWLAAYRTTPAYTRLARRYSL